MKFASYCGLLLLEAATALGQTHPQKKRSRKPVVVQKQEHARAQEQEEAFIRNAYEVTTRNCDEVMRHHALPEPEPLDSNRVYTYVEQMPTLHGQGNFARISAAINQQVVVPPTAPGGRVFVRFEVSKQGRANHPRIVKGLRADLDSAVVAAVRKLPRFSPGKQQGQVVPVSFTLLVTIPEKQQR
jgi:TonB family protein